MIDKEEAKLHLGYQYGFIGNPKGFVRDGVASYTDTDTKKETHTPYLHGLWVVRADDIEYAGEPGAGYVAVDCLENTGLVGDEEKFDIQKEHTLTRFVPRERGARLREIIFRDSEVLPRATL